MVNSLSVCKVGGDGLLGSEVVNSSWDISESWSDTGDRLLGDGGSCESWVIVQSLLDAE